MIPNQSGTPARSLLTTAVVCAILAAPAGARAEEPSPDGSHEVALPAAAVAPRITSITRTWTGTAQEQVRVDIVFSQSVTGFTLGDIHVTSAVFASALSGSGASYSVTLNAQQNYEGPVVVSIPTNAAHNAAGEGNIGRSLTFDVDTRIPVILDARIDGNELIVAFSEDLDERFVPAVGDFAVSFIRNSVYNTRAVSRVEVVTRELFLILARPVASGDVVGLFYDDTGAGAVRDLAGNRAFGFTDLSVRNISRQGGPGVPDAPRNLLAVAESSTEVALTWDAPAEDGGRDITGYWIQESSDGGATWFNLERDTESTATSYRRTGLAAGATRHYRVAAINFNGAGAFSSAAVATTRERVPNPPRSLTASRRGTSTIQLNWTAPASSGGGPVAGYRIEWSRTGSSPWTLEATTDSRTTAYTDRDLGPGTTRHYRVAATNSSGRSAWSNVARATTEATVPGAPTGLRATPGGLDGSSQVLLAWTRPATDGGAAITGYRIETSPTGVGRWTPVITVHGVSTTFLHTDLEPGTSRYYRVAAVNRVGRSVWSNLAQGTTNAAAPGRPSGLRARADGPTSITLTWESPATDGGALITGYSIRRRGPHDGTWIIIRSDTRSIAPTFTDTDPSLRPATVYRYQVAAINRVGTGEWSFETAATTHPDVPSAPYSLSAQAVGTSRIDLSWRAPRTTGGAPVLGYRIETSSDAGSTWRIIRRNTGSTATTFSDVNLQPATTRHYRVAAINAAGTGPFSNFARATTDATLPGVPRSLAASAVGTSRIDLSWRVPTNDGGARVTGYRIEVSEDVGVTWEDLVGNTRTTRTTYSHTGLEPATTRHYRVSAVNRIGMGNASRVASATTDATVPDAPTGLMATAVSPTRIDLVWFAPAYDGGAPITGYLIEVSETGAGWTSLVINTGTVGTTFSHTGLLPGSRRHYRVSAINRAGTGTPSASASAATDDPVHRAGRLNTRSCRMWRPR